VKVLAEIPARSAADLPGGTLRRRDLEAFEGLLEKLAGSRSLLVTGSGRAGRRTVALGLATAAAAVGRRTALLECDLADPALADRLGLASAPGLTEYLSCAVTAERILKPVVLAGPGSAGASDALVCVVAGRPSHEGPRLLASDAFAKALEGLVDAYELLVIDGPRLDEWASLTLLEPQVDATIACLGAGEPRRGFSVPVSGIVVAAD
jgi:Mrp family chromosome partitioning ATPase